MATVEIDDMRLPPDFRGMTFSGFKKTEVRKQMLENMIRGRIEPACYWCAELICAGQFLDAWENIIHFMAKHIHLGNPKMPIYVEMRYGVFRNIIHQGIYLNDIGIRNSAEIRKLFAEVICNLTLSPRKPSFEPVKIRRAEEFDITQMSERLKADSTKYAEAVFQPKDPQELMIAVNEFGYHLKTKNMPMCCYWIEWIIEFEVVCRSKKQVSRCVARNYVDESKYRGDLIWLLWDVVMVECGERKNAFVDKVVHSLLGLFTIKYTTAAAKKRRYLLYMVVELFTETVNPNVDIVADKTILANVVSQIDNVYKQIKKNEQGSNMNYLYDGMDKEAAFKRTVQKLEMMDQLDFV